MQYGMDKNPRQQQKGTLVHIDTYDIILQYRHMKTEDIITAIEEIAKSSGHSPSTVTGRVVGNSRLYQRLKDGGSCTVRIAEKIMQEATL